MLILKRAAIDILSRTKLFFLFILLICVMHEKNNSNLNEVCN